MVEHVEDAEDAALHVPVYLNNIKKRVNIMYKIIQNFGNLNDMAMVVANMSIAIVGDSDDLSTVDILKEKINSIMVGISDTEKELIKLDAFQGIFITIFQTNRATAKSRLNTIMDRLFGDMSFYPFEAMWEIHERFAVLSNNHANIEQIGALRNISSNTIPSESILGYLIKRELLNLLMRTTVFIENIELVRGLVNEINAISENIKNHANSLGGEVFFYGGNERVIEV